MASFRHRCAGFTLVELLVVVSILSLLMTIMLPALTRAQRQAEGVHCLANQRDLTLAWTQYSIDHDDKLCEPNSYVSDMKAYIPIRETLQCKTAQVGVNRASYGMSNTMGGEQRDGTFPFEKMHLVTQPARKMVFIDVGVSGFEATLSVAPYWPLLREIDTSTNNAQKSPWIWRPWSSSLLGSLQSTTARHDNGCNMSFADGHVEYTRWRDNRTLKLIKGMMVDSKEGSEDNRDLKRLVDILVPPSSKSRGGTDKDATHP